MYTNLNNFVIVWYIHCEQTQDIKLHDPYIGENLGSRYFQDGRAFKFKHYVICHLRF